MKLKPLIDAYTGPYKDKYRFWTGLCLILRILLTVIFIFTSEESSLLNNFFIALTIMLTIIGSKVYRNKYNAIIEIFSYINLFILASITTPLSINDMDGKLVSMVSTISITLEMLSLLVIVVHFLTAMKRGRKSCDRIGLYNNQRNYGSFVEDPPSPGCQTWEALIYYDKRHNANHFVPPGAHIM